MVLQFTKEFGTELTVQAPTVDKSCVCFRYGNNSTDGGKGATGLVLLHEMSRQLPF